MLMWLILFVWSIAIALLGYLVHVKTKEADVSLKQIELLIAGVNKNIENSIEAMSDRLASAESLKESSENLGRSLETSKGISNRSGVIRFGFGITGLMNAKNESLYSNSVKAGGAEWYLKVKKEMDEEKLGLGIYLYYKQILQDISHNTNFSIYLFGTKRNIIVKHERLYDKEMNNRGWGWPAFLSWDEFFDISNGFVNENGNAVIQAEFTVVISNDSVLSSIDKFSASTSFLSDVVLIVEGHRIQVNKGLLSIYSPFFNTLFNGNFVEKNQSEVKLEGIQVAEFTQLLQTIYPLCQGNEINDTNMECLLRLADRFQVNSVIHRCENYLMGTACKMTNGEKLVLAQEYRLANLQDFCIKECKTTADVKKLQSTDEYAQLDDRTKVLLWENSAKLSL